MIWLIILLNAPVDFNIERVSSIAYGIDMNYLTEKLSQFKQRHHQSQSHEEMDTQSTHLSRDLPLSEQ
jgi:hypothetical protein